MTTSRALRRASAATAAAALGLAGAAFAVQPAMAATLTVTNTLDAGDGSLRDAIEDANLTVEPDTIVFDGVTGSIELLSTIDITAPVTITGPGAEALTITRDGAFDLFFFNNAGAPGDLTVAGLAFEAGEEVGDTGRAFDILGFDANVSFSSSSFTGFSVDGDGGAVRIDTAGNVGITDVVASDNEALDAGGAFDIFADGDVDVVGSAFRTNSADSGGGVSIGAASGSTSILGTTFDGNVASQGGGLIFGPAEGSLTIDGSTFSNNSAENIAGGLAVAAALGGTTVNDSVFTGNSSANIAGGALLSNVGGSVDVTASVFEGNSALAGGGAFIASLAPSGELEFGAVAVSDSLFTHNEAIQGGGLVLAAADDEEDAAVSAVIERSTFSSNTVTAADGLDAIGQGALVVVGGVNIVDIVNSTFDEPSSSSDASYALAVVGEGGLVELLHSTVVGAGGVGIAVADTGEATDPAAVLLSHDIVQSTTDAGAVDVFEVVVEARAAAAGDASSWLAVASRGAAPAAGPLLTDDFYTLEWSVVSSDVDPAVVAEGPGNQLNTDAELAPLADNGGLTPTRLPAQTSPAVNAGDPAVTGAPATDQRGLARVVETIDVGAVELAAPAPELAATGGTVNWTLLFGAAGILLLGAAGLVVARTRRA